MNKIVSILLISLLYFLIAAPAFAADSGWQTITKMRSYPDGNGSVIVWVDGSFSPGNCTDTNNYRIDDVSGVANHVYSALLAAFMSGKQVKAHFTGLCTPSMNIVASLEIQ